MKRLWLITLVALTLILTSCKGTQGVTASLGKEFTLPIGETAAITGEDIKIKFAEVIEDSRCPKGAVCIWEGRVSVLVEITRGPSIKPTVFTQPGLSGDNGKEVYEDLNFAFNVEPYPEVGKQIKPGEYRLVLTISK